MEQRLNKKLEPILKYTVMSYIEDAQPISSSNLITKYQNYLHCSSAKIRYIMNELEKLGYLQKSHNSSGRTPTVKGLNYYAKYLSHTWEDKMRKKIDEILKQKHIDINNTVEEAANVISEITGLTLVTNEITKDALLKSIDIVPIQVQQATVVLVISTGEVFSKIVNFSSAIPVTDLKVAVRIFKERLIDSPLKELSQRVVLLKDILAKSVNNYQSIIDSIVNQVFDTYLNQENVNKKIYGKNNIILSNQIQREDLNTLIQLVEKHSVWEKIQEQADQEENIKISVDNTGTYMSKRIESNSKITEISVVGAMNSDFDKMKTAINALDEILKEINNKKGE
ncbi:heat-inducible transcriptional repressor HrcA [Mycoplasmopsis cynos]|nr:heat-inducible transcriptional repressor HrcA [Mycoplasmopsis cynos]TQC55001.1 heat-inducible transcriptional repressor HrcA [Mycoplasmopsis cynos]WQQ13429.1 heat-inducible transcriptional repressor HrcA [Mycoplasmopsis cynos]WQQ13704.1 heat-inducible transcriptional repressor HrcA [Mycoplasmopsis cynos]WQQ14328.1 heat-inducible transcriptional repressor HrcA [Mycoplasmopsis cynos]WQQ15439.1 heat-inducible transcriptional repressor HrcA [Mycoplasmopsis cynos]